MKSEALSGGNWIPVLLFETPSDLLSKPLTNYTTDRSYILPHCWLNDFQRSSTEELCCQSHSVHLKQAFPLTQEGFIRRCDSWKVFRKYLPTMILTKCLTSPQDIDTVLVRDQHRWALGINSYFNLDWTQLIGWSCHVKEKTPDDLKQCRTVSSGDCL